MIAALVIARLLLAGVFAVAGTAKIADLAGSRKTLVDFGLPEMLVRPLSILLPLFELACAIALLPAVSAWWGAVAVLAMLLLFTTAISVNLARGRTPDCHCFGQLHSERIGWKTIVRNAALATVSAFILWQRANHAGLGLLDTFERLSRVELALLSLAALAALQLWFSVHLLRQNGRLFLLVEALEAKQGPKPEPPPPGLPINTTAPEFSLKALEGSVVTLGELLDESKSLVLAFIEPGCAHCDTLLPELAQWQEEHDDLVSIVIVSRGKPEANRAKIAGLELRNVLLQNDRETAESYMVTVTPSAVLITNGQMASSVAEGIDAIRALVGRAILPPAVKKGDSAPSLVLADLTGQRVDLGTLRGRRSLLLFWNPSCGFCQQMLPDVKRWENDRGDGSPELLVISSGSFEDIHAQGFRSRVLLDPHWGANQVFGAGGTPSAVLIDEDGKVASEVGAGADDVWALTGAVRSATAKA
jgi:thiol-disulfide isomerase/thioredoxin/uncharacterized membrane protein YphA (DoxX/SURF4 family)